MATRVVMAQLSPTMEEGRLVEWKVAEGDEIEQGDVVAEIETDKANMDVEALGSGVLRKIVVHEGETVPVGALIGVIAAEDEDIDAILEEAEAAGAEEEDEEGRAGATAAKAESGEDGEGAAEEEAGEEAAEPARAGAAAGKQAGAGGGGQDESAGEGRTTTAGGRSRDGGRLRASPLARRMAEDQGLDLSRIEGSGPGGRIVKADIQEAIESGAAAGASRAEGGRAEAGPARLSEETVQLSQMRKAIARRLTQSLGPVPHFFLTTEIDMGRALELRAELNEQIGGGEGGPKVGVNDLLLKAAAEALVRHPEVNASWGEGEIRRHGRVDLGIAVALEDGLITPVLRDADRKGLVQITSEARELIDRARQRKLNPDEYQGATFSLSNLGMFPIEEFTAIINPPEAAILAVGRTAEKPVVVDGEVVVRRRMRVTMSCDHRVVDGATGARFLETFKGMLENPLAMLA